MFKKILQKDLKKKAGLVGQISSKFIAHIVYANGTQHAAQANPCVGGGDSCPNNNN